MKTARIHHKILSLLLILAALFSLLPAAPKASAQTDTVPSELETDASAQPLSILTADSQILRYVDREVLESGNHILRLNNEETNNTYVYLNTDGTKTIYYLDEDVKFVDANGLTHEKDLTLTATVGGYTTTQNDIGLSIPTNPNSGVTLLWEGHAVRLIPQGGTVGETFVENNAVHYTDFYGDGTTLIYTPTLSGVKEDIVLDYYTGQTSFTFLLNTGGLYLYNSGGRYYLASSKVAIDRIELSDVVTFDTRGRFSIGSMSAQAITPGQIYQLTITVDESFLTDPNTSYPVTIDPSLTVSASGNSSLIEDTTIYQGKPTTNGNWTYLHAGYYDDTYGTARTLFRLKGLLNDATYKSLTAGQINSATFHIKEASGTSAVTVELYANTGSSAWTESGATWNNAGVTLSTLISSVSVGSGSVAAFNITNLVKGWISGTYSATKGFILKSTNETTKDKAFYSSEYSTSSYRPYVTINYKDSITLNCSTLTLYKNATYTFTATTQPTGQNVTWTSSNPSVANFVSDGVLAALREGTTVVTATSEDGGSASCVVYVRLSNGVYRLQNQHSKLYLSVNADKLDQVHYATHQTLSSISSDPLQYYAQLWKIEYLANGRYSIRPMYSLGCGLTVSGTVAIAAEIGTETSQASIPTAAQWTISYENGYVIQNAGLSNKTLIVPNNSTTSGQNLMIGSYTASAASHRWDIVAAESISNILLLIDLENGTISNTLTRYIAPGEPLTLEDMGIAVSFVSESTNSQAVSVTSSNSNASYSQQTQSVTGNIPNTATNLTFQMRVNGALYSRTLSVVVSAIPDGTYFVRNKSLDAYLQIEVDASNKMTTDLIMELYEFEDADYQKWIVTLLDDGYYKIISKESGLALSVAPSHLNSADKALIQQLYVGEDRQKWNITISNSGSCVLRPKSAENFTSDWCVSAGTGAGVNGRDVEQRTYSSNPDYTDEWFFEFNGSYGVIYFYDQAFSVREPNAAELLFSCHTVVSDRLSRIFDVSIIYSFNTYTSICDNCKTDLFGTISTNNMDSMCSHTDNCLSTSRLRTGLLADVGAGNNKNTVVLLTGSRMKDNMGDRSNSDSSTHSIIITPTHPWPWSNASNSYVALGDADRREEYIFTIIHELSHQLGAPDHYCYGRENGVCSNPNCDRCYTGIERESCMMTDRFYLSTKSDADMYCSDCYEIISNHLNNHH